MNLKAHEFTTIERKLKLEVRNGPDRHAFFWYGGKLIVKTRRSHCKGDLPAANLIRQQLKLSEKQLRDLIACTFSYDDYVRVLRDKGLISAPES